MCEETISIFVNDISVCIVYSRMEMISVPGKRARPVPILLTDDMSKAMAVLARKRTEVEVPKENVYFFAIPKTMAHIGYYSILQKIATAAGLRQPRLLTTTRMRKHVATMAQVFTAFCAKFEKTICLALVLLWGKFFCACLQTTCYRN